MAAPARGAAAPGSAGDVGTREDMPYMVQAPCHPAKSLI